MFRQLQRHGLTTRCLSLVRTIAGNLKRGIPGHAPRPADRTEATLADIAAIMGNIATAYVISQEAEAAGRPRRFADES